MKFGEKLRSEIVPEWSSLYLDYDKLKNMIKELEAYHLYDTQITDKGTSLSIPRPTNDAGMPVTRSVTETSQEMFFRVLEQEMRKIEEFTKKQVFEIRKVLSEVQTQLHIFGRGDSTSSVSAAVSEAMRVKMEKAGEDFLKIEKYVNLNFTGFHKILKKHDRRLPNPCKDFYIRRLHDQSWVRGDHSDIMVVMSRVYSTLRGDEVVAEKESSRQNFVRSTRKYWVHTEDVTPVKYAILPHLPVFLQKTMVGDIDSQLVNSVYLDNYAMELYHGRLDKNPGAIALRFRWYGTGTPDTVFVERKTHREKWTGDLSVKERFVVKESQIKSLLNGTFDVEGEVAKMRGKGKSEEDVLEYTELVREVIQAINSKQLIPTIRTQYMRTAFQVPFDASVRISLDTNLCMINERTKEALAGDRWYRDPSVRVPANEITRFPHGVLEVKLQLEESSKTPEWVTELLQSGKLMEVHKFSKFIHGCAVIIPEDVRTVPYWIDDVTLKESIARSGATSLLNSNLGANAYYSQLLPHDNVGNSKVALAAQSSAAEPANPVGKNGIASEPFVRRRAPAEDEETGSANESASFSLCMQIPHDCCGGYIHHHEDCCEWAEEMHGDHITTQKVEPKLFLANERTFIKWLHMAVLLSSISIGILAFSKPDSQSQYYAVLLLPLSLLFIFYALSTYLWRSEKIRTRDNNRWDDPYGPVILTVLLILALMVQFVFKLSEVMYPAPDL